MAKPQNPRIARKVEALAAKIPGATYRLSNNGVPMAVVDVPGELYRYSLCYFGKTKKWRVFYPYAVFGAAQTKTDFFTEQDLIAFFHAKYI